MRGISMIAPALAAVASSFHPGACVRADSPPPPFFEEQPFVEIIEKAGYHCGPDASHAPATGADADALVKLGLEPFVVRCEITGKTYLVGKPRVGPDGHPLNSAAPIVKEIVGNG
jgi:hypothetical protein